MNDEALNPFESRRAGSRALEADSCHLQRIAESMRGRAEDVQDVYRLSPLQEGILFHHLLNQQSDTYVLSMLFELDSRAEVDVLVGALERVMVRHDILRTAVRWQNLPQPMQVVFRRACLPVQEVELDPTRETAAQLKELLRPGRERMDLQQAPLMRLRIAADPHSPRCYGVLQVHHVACDHQSLRTVVAEALACIDGAESTLPAAVPFRSYVAQALAKAESDDAEAFFRSKLGDIDEPTAPFGLLDTHRDGIQIEEFAQCMDPSLAGQIRTQARLAGVSAARLFHAAWALVVARTSGRHDVVFGTVVLAAQQRTADAQRMLGLSVNTLPLRLSLGGLTAAQLVEYTNGELTQLLCHEATPLTLAQRCSGLSGAMPLFTSLLNYRHTRPDPQERRGAGGIRVLARGEAWTNYPLTLTVDDVGDGFVVSAKVDRIVGGERIISYLFTALRSIAEALGSAPHLPALALPILPEAERRLVIDEFNATQRAFPAEKLLHELIEEQIARAPDAVAVTFGEQQVTYHELNARANKLARHLKLRGVGPDRLVGVLIERSIDMVTGLLGVLTAGGAYVPLDPTNPVERLEHVLSDAKPLVLLTQEELRGKLPKTTAEIVALDTDWAQIAMHDAHNLSREGLSSRNVAYVIYTSGSTGVPKGVMVEHRNLVNYTTHVMQQFDVAAGNGSLICTSASFDLMLTGFYPTLVCGKTVRLCREQQRLPLLAEELVHCTDLAPLKLTPAHLSLLERPLRAGQLAGRVRVLVLGGEQLQSATVELWRRHAPATRIFNHYGPTEATIGCVVQEITELGSGTVPIGRPISNARVYVLDSRLNAVPVGVIGELHIGGAAVTRGYWNRPELTAERFLADPFAEPDARMYRTGDLGRWRADGTIEYLGRNDHQVKIRGYRVELGEVEAALLRDEHVRQAVVLAREDEPGNKRLVAYVVPCDVSPPAATPCVDALRERLRAALPEYMVPSAVVMLERLPLTQNGKLDRSALPLPDASPLATRQYEPPRGEVEETLADIWRQLLRLDRVGRHDNFFELGGHSLLILQMLEQLRQAGLPVEVRRVFESPTLADLASAMSDRSTATLQVPPNRIPQHCTAITPEMLPLVELRPEHIERIVQHVPGGAANVQDIYPLAPLQEGILFLHLLNEESGDPYVVPMRLAVASRQRLKELTSAFQAVIDRHDVLRTAIYWDQLPRPVQVVYRRAALPVEEIALAPECSSVARLEEWLARDQHRMDLRTAPLLRLKVLADARTGRYDVLLLLHHIVCDYTSRDIVTSEVMAAVQGRAQVLPAPVPYRNHVAHALAYARTNAPETFFRRKLGDAVEPTAPFGLMNVYGDGGQTDEAAVELNATLSGLLRRQARRAGVSAAALFHAAWALVLAVASGRDDVVFGTVLLGRMQGNVGTQRTLGMFINTLPLRLRLQGMTARELVQQTHRELIELLDHEQASLAVAQRCSGITGSGPLFTALLNYRHSSAKHESDASPVDGIQLVAGRARTNYPLALSIDDTGDSFSLSAQSDRQIDPRRIVGYVQAALRSLAVALDEMSETPARSLSILPEEERRLVVETFNATDASYPREQLTHELFEQQVQRTPNAVAVAYENEALTYLELNRRANRLAHCLRSRGLAPGDFVPLVMERSLQMLVAHLAVLKCGAVYVPIDPQLPTDRRSFMVRDCGARYVLTAGTVTGDFPEHCALIDCSALADAAGFSDTDLRLRMDSGAPCYVMYTSGSTGVPKGVVVPHYAVNRLALNNGYAAIGPTDCVAHYSNPAFDASTFEIWVALLNGAKVVVVPQQVVLEPRRFAELLERERVTVLYMSVGLFNQCTEALAGVFARLRYLLVGGESLEPGAIRRVLRNSPPRRLLNAYGPTEGTTFTTTYPIDDAPEDASSISIGRPIANSRAYILDADRRPVPVGVVGEMYIGGDGVATAYLNRPELTAERFVADPFRADPKARLYRTGDLARWRADGTLDFLGRNDHQVKIRGFRIELGEIETRLAQHSSIGEAAVIAREDVPGDKRLVAYYVVVDGADAPTAEELRAYLKSSLPEYMLPGAYVALDCMPLTSTGKVDRRALPMPAIAAYASRGYEPPQGEVEQRLAGIWQRVLGIERIGREDDFFEIGGHSLLAMKAVSEVKQTLGIALKVTDAYKCPTVRELAGRIAAGTVEDRPIDLRREAALDSSIAAQPGSRGPAAAGILLTGATGFVGRFLLSQLLADTTARIHCLVRAPSAGQAAFRLRRTLLHWGLDQADVAARVVAVPGDLRLPDLGLDAATQRTLAHEIDTIYHCATSMNHLETYQMARAANVESCRQLLQLATRGQPKIINFISTLGVFNSLPGNAPRSVDEQTAIDNEVHWNSRGYVASKWVGEKVFVTARERGIACNVFRLGLVWADSRRGRYDELQREYRILKSCLLAGVGIADYRYDMCPTPVDYVARAVVHLGELHRNGGGTFHISSRLQAIDGLFECCNEITDSPLNLLPFWTWIGEMRRLHEQGRSLPVVPLIEFAFSLSEEAFQAHRRNAVSASTRFDCTRTQRELERAGIVAPIVDNELLKLCLEDMLTRDVDWHELRSEGLIGSREQADAEVPMRHDPAGSQQPSAVARVHGQR